MSVAAKGYASINRVRAASSARRPISQGQEAAMTRRICPRRRRHRRNPHAVAVGQPRRASNRSRAILRTRRPSCPKRCPSWSRRASSCSTRWSARRRPGQVVGLTVFTVGGVVAARPDADGRRSRRPRAGHPGAGQPRRRRRRLSSARPRRFASSASTTARCRCSAARCGPCRPTASPTRRPAAPTSAPRSSCPDAELNRVRSVLGNGELRPGLPVEAVLTVRKRTALQYLLEPLTGALWRSGHED